MRPSHISTYFDILGKAQKVYNKQLEPVCRKWELTRSELDVLLFLLNNPGFDRATDIVTHRGMAKSHVSLSVTSLADRQLLSREFSAVDRRTAHLILTEAGRAIAEEARIAQNQFFELIYSGIPREELTQLNRITLQVFENIDHFANP